MRIEVTSPWSGATLGSVEEASASEIEAAHDRAHAAKLRLLPLYERVEILERVAAAVQRDADELAALICAESAKPIRFAQAEVARAVVTLKTTAAEARTLVGEVLPLDATFAGAGTLSFTVREPAGVVVAITPFNFPLNLVAHKLGPAIDAGCPVILKPAEATPLSGERLVRLFHEAGLPREMLQVIHGRGASVVPSLVMRADVVSFTGSLAVGRALQRAAPDRPVHLELGGSAAALVEPDADLDAVVPRLALGAFGMAGQSCISVQRVLVRGERVREVTGRLVAAARATDCGDPALESTIVGPLVRVRDAERVLGVLDAARTAGARIVTGGHRGAHPALVVPTVVDTVEPTATVACEEIFGPVLCVLPYDTLEEGIALANTAPMLNASIFTHDLARAMRSVRGLRCGAVLVNESPTWRADPMPYGGDGDAGNTREGPRWAIRHLSREKLVVLPDATRRDG